MIKKYQKYFSLITYAAAYGLVAVMHKGLGFLLFFWLAHTLTQDEYALFGLFYALQTGLIAILTAGIVEMVIGHHRASFDEQRRHQIYSVGNGVFVWLILAASLVALCIYYGFLLQYADILDIGLIFLGGLLLAFFTLQASFVRLDELHSKSLALNFIPPVMGLIFGYLGFIYWGGLTAFFGCMAAILLIMFLVFSRFNFLHLKLSLRVSQLVSVRYEIVPYIVIAFLVWLSGYGSNYIVKSIFNMANVAEFMFLYTLSSVLHIAATSLNQVWSPRFFRVVHELPLNELERKNVIFFGVQGLMLGVVGAVVLLLLRPGIDIVGGNMAGYRDTGQGLAWLFAGYAVAVPWWHAQNYFYAHKQGRPLMKLVAISTVLGILVWLGLMLTLGLHGIYVGFFAQMLIRSLIVYLYARSIWGIRFTWHGPFAAIGLFLTGLLLAEFFWP